MKDKVLLTAIIFTYNHKPSIAKCIEIIVNQKTNYRYEIHVCDDCSTDGTTEICEKYVKKYPDKIKFFPQKENTFLYPYRNNHLSQAIKRINTRYFCIIDGDDYWIGDYKIEMALSFLEKNPNFIGWASDSLQIDTHNNTQYSYIHDIMGMDPKETVVFSAEAPFFLTGARILRNIGFAKLGLSPADYILYYWHLKHGSIHYHDEITSAYVHSPQSCFVSGAAGNIIDLVTMQPYKLCKLFRFKEDNFCTNLLKIYGKRNFSDEKMKLLHYNRLILLKKFFGKKGGWALWFIFHFIFKYGIESLDINYIYSRKKVHAYANKRCS